MAGGCVVSWAPVFALGELGGKPVNVVGEPMPEQLLRRGHAAPATIQERSVTMLVT